MAAQKPADTIYQSAIILIWVLMINKKAYLPLRHPPECAGTRLIVHQGIGRVLVY